MVLITIVTGAYKPTYNWGGHPASLRSFICICKFPYHILPYQNISYHYHQVSLPNLPPLEFTSEDPQKWSAFLQIQLISDPPWCWNIYHLAQESFTKHVVNSGK